MKRSILLIDAKDLKVGDIFFCKGMEGDPYIFLLIKKKRYKTNSGGFFTESFSLRIHNIYQDFVTHDRLFYVVNS